MFSGTPRSGGGGGTQSKGSGSLEASTQAEWIEPCLLTLPLQAYSSPFASPAQ